MRQQRTLVSRPKRELRTAPVLRSARPFGDVAIVGVPGEDFPMQARYLIRAATEADLPLMSRWRSASHVARWRGDAKVEPESEKLGDTRVAMWIAEHQTRAFAFIQDYAVADWRPHHFDYLPSGSRGMDVYIGEPDLIGMGHGSAVVRQHVDHLISCGAPAVGIDPHPDNHAARRAFEKAGFSVAWGPVETRWSRATLMDRFAP